MVFLALLTILHATPAGARPVHELRIFTGALIVRTFDNQRVFAAIETPGNATRIGVADQLFLYRTAIPTQSVIDLADAHGRIIRTEQGLVIIAPERKTAMVLSLDEPADEDLDLGLGETGYNVIRIANGTGYKQLEGLQIRMLDLAQVERPSSTPSRFAGGQCCEVLYSDWDLGGGGGGGNGAGTCAAGGAGSTSCSYSCGGTSCTVACSRNLIPCCDCVNGAASCRCI